MRKGYLTSGILALGFATGCLGTQKWPEPKPYKPGTAPVTTMDAEGSRTDFSPYVQRVSNAIDTLSNSLQTRRIAFDNYVRTAFDQNARARMERSTSYIENTFNKTDVADAEETNKNQEEVRKALGGSN